LLSLEPESAAEQPLSHGLRVKLCEPDESNARGKTHSLHYGAKSFTGEKEAQFIQMQTARSQSYLSLEA
jgi:hypothetical protein